MYYQFEYLNTVLSLVITLSLFCHNDGWLLHTSILSYGGYSFFQVHKILKWIYLTFGHGRGCALGRNWWTASALDVVHPEAKKKKKKLGCVGKTRITCLGGFRLFYPDILCVDIITLLYKPSTQKIIQAQPSTLPWLGQGRIMVPPGPEAQATAGSSYVYLQYWAY